MKTTDPKKYLNKIRHIDSDINSRQEELANFRRSIMIKTSTIKEQVVQEARTGAFDDRYMRLIELGEELNKKIDELVDEKVRVSNEIDMLDDRVSRVILREKYINLKTLEEITEILGYELRWTNRLHGKALEDFKECMLEHVNAR